MRLILAFALAAAAALAQAQTDRPARAASTPILVDRIVAVVNNEVITQRELEERIQITVQQLRAQKVPLPSKEVLERQVLERMITDRAQIQFAKSTGLRVDDLTLDRAISRIAESNNMSLPQFRRALERDGIPYDRFREEVRNEILISRLREREVDDKIQVSDAEIEQFLDSNQPGAKAPAEYNLRHILVRVPEQASPEQLQRQLGRAQAAKKELAAGADFAQVAVSYSDAPDALQGGGLGWRSSDRLPELFAQALASMKQGDVSDILRSPAGFHILKIEGVRGGAAGMVVDQTRARHILVRVNEAVSESDARRKLDLLRERIRGGAEFAELARLNSDDPSAARGGDLGWIYPGDTVPEFERAMNALKIGEVSEPVRTPFGWHLIQVLERRRGDIGADRRKLEARRILRDRKIDEAYQEWLRQLRDQAYVDYRLEER